MIIDIIAKILIPLVGAVLTIIIYPLIKAKTTKEQRDAMQIIVDSAVYGAEQLNDAGLLPIPKKDFVLDYLRKKGWDITEKDLDIMIEAAVKALNIEQEDIK